MFHSQAVIDYINEKLMLTWPPEQIACTPCEPIMPNWRTIHRWICEMNGNLKVLRRKGKTCGTKETRDNRDFGRGVDLPNNPAGNQTSAKLDVSSSF